MENMINLLNSQNNTYLVLVKGFTCIPKRLNVIKCENNFITVAGMSGKTQMKLKAQYVYQYDEEMYQKLRNAYELNDKGTLEKVWQQAKPITTLS
jgi:phage regulator Rha-like protein